MAVPKKKTTRARRNKRRAGKGLPKTTLILCAQCKKMISSHQVCPYCGMYKGRMVLDIEAKEKKKKRKKKQRQDNK